MIRHFQERMPEGLSVRDVHPDAVAATEATKIQSRQRGGILISPVGFAETVLHSPSGLASVPGSISAGPIVLAATPVSSLIVAAIVRASRRRAIARTRRRSVARTRRRSVAVAWGWSIARTWLNIDMLGECRAGCAGENCSYEPRYQHLLHDSSLRDRATDSGAVAELDRALTPAAIRRPARRPG